MSVNNVISFQIYIQENENALHKKSCCHFSGELPVIAENAAL
ncbi:MAG TPA: hypothetical protein VIH61_02285 [Waddliaceae bacterium]